MAFERKNPIPPGRYWVDVPNNLLNTFDVWRRQSGAKVVSAKGNDDPDGRTIVVFELSKPTERWGEALLPIGFPNRSTGDVRDSTNVVRKPVVKSPLDSASDFFSGLLKTSGGMIAVAAALYLLSQKKR